MERSLEELNLEDADRDAVLEVKRRLQETFPFVKRLVIFGSVARGEAGPDSDLDLLALTEQELPRSVKHQIYDVIFDANLEFGTDLNIICIGEEKWNGGALVVPIRPDVEREGVTV